MIKTTENLPEIVRELFKESSKSPLGSIRTNAKSGFQARFVARVVAPLFSIL